MRNFLMLITLSCLFSCSPNASDDKPQGVLSDAQKKTLEQSSKTSEVLEQANKERKEKSGEE